VVSRLTAPEHGVRIAAGHAAVLRRVERGQTEEAFGELRRLLAAARRHDQPHLLPELRLTMAWVELDRGRPAAGLRQLRTAEPELPGERAAQARCLRGLHLNATGRHAAAHQELTAAIDDSRAHGDRHWLANALVARGAAGGYLLALAGAEADYAEAGELYTALGEQGRAAACLHNRGFVALRAGDLPAALRRFAEAVEAGLPVDRHPEALVDRAQALLAAGLTERARPLLEQAVDALSAAGRDGKLAEALLVSAQCALRAGAAETAERAAGRAARLFGRQGRPGWRAAARAVELMAAPRTMSATTVHRLARDCDRHGWWLVAAELRLAAAAAMPADATHWLTRVAVDRRRGPVPVRVLGWVAAARLAMAAGDHRRAGAACRAGLRLVEEYAAALGGWELRAGMSSLTRELSALGLDIALAGGRPETVLRWADRSRGVALRRPEVLPPVDPELADGLTELRVAATDGRRDARRLVALEERIRALDWAHADGRTRGFAWKLDDLATRLDASALLSFVIHGGQLICLSVVDGRCRRQELGPSRRIEELVRSLRLALAAGPAAARSARRAANALDRQLFAPIRRLVADRRLVVVPTDALHALPWGALPSCVGRPITVAPSIHVWRQAVDADTSRDGEPVWISGPGLRHAEIEVRALHAEHGGRLLAGYQSTVDDALAAMDGADTVHIAAHGRFRPEAPLFSRLDLADGPLYGYDLRRLRRAPRRIVLSACEVGRSAVRPGDELIGLAAALLRAGSATVLASVLPVPDEAAVPVMTLVHQGLRDGLGPAEALATAQARHGQLGFSCLGSG
jgi:CHAT domain-containing protein